MPGSPGRVVDSLAHTDTFVWDTVVDSTHFTGGGINLNVGKNKLVGILMTSFSAFVGFLYGYDSPSISGVKEILYCFIGYKHSETPLQEIQALRMPSPHPQNLVVSSLSAGTFIGALLGNTNRPIRFISITLVGDGELSSTVSSSMLVWRLHHHSILVGRVFAGLNPGLGGCLVLYQSECAPKQIRGAVVSLYMRAGTAGLLLADREQCEKRHAISRCLSYPNQHSVHFCLHSSFCNGYSPESPRWLIKRDRFNDTAKSLSRLTSLTFSGPGPSRDRP
ncbi:hypothetical protein K435DRAFT_867575 [Dendrothele bispora CBS 962.96]|uniref:Major facilitator superfamily (MFS) profile domain-containing protein n=1 Tax=Dendrothele bispora (strain CBS 962.96) TaxID=1314807 RepID=A0A4S8LDW6_DENBC|nr:hypothetical protein K435DRAFT_867575 [Dendrothele bispora CBS 962.96]